MSRLGIDLVGLMPKLEVNGFELGAADTWLPTSFEC